MPFMSYIQLIITPVLMQENNTIVKPVRAVPGVYPFATLA